MSDRAHLQRRSIIRKDEGWHVHENGQPPSRITGAVAIGSKPSALLRRVGRLSAVSGMAIVMCGEFSPTDPAILDASFYGVGFGKVVGHDVEMVGFV